MLVMALVVKSDASFSNIGNHYYNLWFPTKINTWASIVVNSFMTEAVTIQKPVHWFALQINGLVSIW